MRSATGSVAIALNSLSTDFGVMSAFVLLQSRAMVAMTATRSPETASRISTAMINVWFETLDQTQKQGLEWMLFEVLRATAELSP